MFKISESTAIALHSIIYIANREGKTIPLKEIETRFNISGNHLSKVLQRLKKEGFIKSVKGPKGGFSIVPKYKNLTFLDIYELMEGKIQQHACLFNSHPNNCQNCIMGNLIQDTNNNIINFMKNKKITDVSL
ncbi:MAG: Rrf2 family transcriptional regulator [Alphaproteobacteria bacterium]|nr:Rrf2 family transcriptional regulator [Alphaproteobacteria bacterium]